MGPLPLVPRHIRPLLALLLIGLYLLATYRGHATLNTSIEASTAPIPVIIFAFNPADSLRQTIDSVLSALPSPSSLYPIFISQDGDDAEVAKVIASYGPQVTHLHYHYVTSSSTSFVTPYFRITEHYRTALTTIMDDIPGHEHWNRAIMLEDDMLVSPDFFSYFRRMSPLFDTDPSLYCVSAFNENGRKALVDSATTVYRTDCFPGMAWMWSRGLWDEMRSWPPAYWDDWLRQPEQRKGRSCVYPEISRVYTSGREGFGNGMFFDRWYRDIEPYEENVHWEAVDIDHLEEKEYDRWLSQRLMEAKSELGVEQAHFFIDLDLENDAGGSLQIMERVLTYGDIQDLTDLMEVTGMNYDHKAGVPRTSYKDVVQYRYRGCRVWIMPEYLELPLKEVSDR